MIIAKLALLLALNTGWSQELDLSTPGKTFESFMEAIQTGNTELFQSTITPDLRAKLEEHAREGASWEYLVKQYAKIFKPGSKLGARLSDETGGINFEEPGVINFIVVVKIHGQEMQLSRPMAFFNTAPNQWRIFFRLVCF